MSPDEAAAARAADDRHHSLEELRAHWDEAYSIWYRAGEYWARRKDDGKLLHYADPQTLKSMIRENYAVRPVPRSVDLAKPQDVDLMATILIVIMAILAAIITALSAMIVRYSRKITRASDEVRKNAQFIVEHTVGSDPLPPTYIP